MYSGDPLVRRSPPLRKTRHAQAPVAWVGPALYRRLGLMAGDFLRVTQQGGEAVVPVGVDERLPEDCIRLAAARPETAALGPMFGVITAERVAMRRAAHQVLDTPPVFEDPLALKVLGLSPGDVPPDDVESARESRQRRAFIAARSRYVEDELARLVARGVDQYVVLGAGLDTFACRNSDPRLRVFEVDHPATQAWKRERLASTGIMPPDIYTD